MAATRLKSTRDAMRCHRFASLGHAFISAPLYSAGRLTTPESAYIIWGMASFRQRSAYPAYVAAWAVDHLLGSRKLEPMRAVRERLHGALTRPTGVPNRIERVPELSIRYLDRATFKRYLFGGPVVFKGLASEAPALREWTFEALQERYGDWEQSAQRSGEAYWESTVLKLSEVLRGIVAGNARYAIRAGKGNLFAWDPKLREELAVASWGDEEFFNKRAAYRREVLFLSGVGHWTPMHSEMGQVLSTQVRGSRRWTIFDPRFSPYLFPEIGRALVFHTDLYANASPLRQGEFGLKGWECELEEGDVLFCPAFYWHFVETLRPSISVATQLVMLDALARHPLMTAMVATARNPSMLSFLLKPEDRKKLEARDYVPLRKR